MKDCLREQQMRAVELGGDVHREVELAHRLEGTSGSDIATARLPPRQTRAFERPSAIASMASTASWPVLARRLEAERRVEPSSRCSVGNLGDADGAVALHVGVAAQRTDAGALAPDVAAQQQQVGELLHVAVPWRCCVMPMP